MGCSGIMKDLATGLNRFDVHFTNYTFLCKF